MSVATTLPEPPPTSTYSSCNLLFKFLKHRPSVATCRIFTESLLRCSYSGAQQKITVKLPVTLNKFVDASDMDSTTFFNRWKVLGK